MDLQRILSDECYAVVRRACDLAAEQGRRQVRSIDILEAIAEQETSEAHDLLDKVATDLAVADLEALKTGIMVEYAVRVGV